MTSIADRVNEILHESNEELEGEDSQALDFDEEANEDFGAGDVCVNLDDEGCCCTGCPSAQLSEGDTCSYVFDSSWPDCPCFTPLDETNDSEFAEEA